MPSLKKYFTWSKKYPTFLSKNSGSALNTFLNNHGDEPIYEEIPMAEEPTRSEPLSAGYEGPVKPVEPIYMNVGNAQLALKISSDEPVDEEIPTSEEGIYMDMRGSQPVNVADDLHSRNCPFSNETAANPWLNTQALNSLTQFITTISTESSAHISISIKVNDRPWLELSCH